jgi:hypothetical protein
MKREIGRLSDYPCFGEPSIRIKLKVRGEARGCAFTHCDSSARTSLLVAPAGIEPAPFDKLRMTGAGRSRRVPDSPFGYSLVLTNPLDGR